MPATKPIMSRKEMEKRVRKGVKLLNDVYPDWHKKIYLNLLDLEQELPCLNSGFKSCILGQLFGNFCTATYKVGLTVYQDGLTRTDPATVSMDEACNAAASYGLSFDVDRMAKFKYEDVLASYKVLTQVWKDTIKKLRKAS